MYNCGGNRELQADEVTALASIYAADMSEFDAASSSFSIAIQGSCGGSDSAVVLHVSLPPQYPSDCPPVFEISAPWLRGEARRDLEAGLISMCRDNDGCPVVYAWVEAVRQFLDALMPLPPSGPVPDASEFVVTCSAASGPPIAADQAIEFVHGEPFEDRRSVFQAHLLAPVDSAGGARRGLASLLSSERKIASATHNIWAYRIERLSAGPAPAAIATDSDDDGESQAGGRLLHLLELTDARNVLVVVSRWYGGVQLGPDRFKHINNAARRLLESQGIIQAGAARRHGVGGHSRH